ncbi:protein BatD [bacterium]|nr:protein BatD [candidate division CSSED10-310 bacterium]
MSTRIGKYLALAIVAFLLMQVKTVFAQISLKASVDRNQVYLLDRITYELTIEGSVSNLPEPRLSDFEGFQLLSGPSTSTQISMVNGRFTSKVINTYIFKTIKEGKWVLGPVSVNYKGKTFNSNPVVIDVVKLTVSGSATSGSQSDIESVIPLNKLDDVFLWATVDKTDPYQGQPVFVTYDIYTRVPIAGYNIVQYPSFSGFWAEEVQLPNTPTQYKKRLHGVEYTVATIYKTALYPTVSGELTIDPLMAVFKIRASSRDPFFDDFFQQPFGGFPRSSMLPFAQEIQRSSQALSINIKPLPVTGKPANFTGAVGTFKLIASLDKSTVKVGEAIVLKARLAGNHSLKTLPPPELQSMDSFKTFEPKTGEVTLFDENPEWNVREFDFVFVPHESGEFEIPPLSYNYFDPDEGMYKSIQTDTMHVNVEPGLVSNSMIAIPGEKGNIELLNYDMHYIKTSLPIKSYIQPYTSKWFFVALLIPVIFVPAVLLYGRHQKRMTGDAAYARAFKARTESQRRFNSAVQALEESKLNKALDEIAKGFLGYLGNKFNLSTSGLTFHQIREQFVVRELDKDMISKLNDYWYLLDTLRFAPGEPDVKTLESMLNQAKELVKILENIKLKRKKGWKLSR